MGCLFSSRTERQQTPANTSSHYSSIVHQNNAYRTPTVQPERPARTAPVITPAPVLQIRAVPLVHEYDTYRRLTVQPERPARTAPVITAAPVLQIRAVPRVPANRSLRNIILQQKIASEWSAMSYDKEYLLTEIPEFSLEYTEVQRMFKATTQKHFKVTEIKRVQNPYLLGCYLLKKYEMQALYGEVSEKLVFHGTKLCNIAEICTDNFNWRLHGDSVGNRYGKGVSFSPISCYASNYSDKNCEVKVMFLVRILYHEAVEGNGSMELPPSTGSGNKRYDTAAKENQHVMVKFCDNEFYPQHLIYYTGSYCNKKSKNSKNFHPY